MLLCSTKYGLSAPLDCFGSAPCTSPRTLEAYGLLPVRQEVEVGIKTVIGRRLSWSILLPTWPTADDHTDYQLAKDSHFSPALILLLN
jgi:hypothetical protein